MKAVDPVKQDSFCDSFRTVVNDIPEGLSYRKYAAANIHWMKGSEFCQDFALDCLLVL